MAEKLVGQNYETPDIRAKVTGRARYAADVARGLERFFDYLRWREPADSGKTQMVRELLDLFPTRPALVIGDRGERGVVLGALAQRAARQPERSRRRAGCCWISRSCATATSIAALTARATFWRAGSRGSGSVSQYTRASPSRR